MKPVFADTSYYVALLNPADENHAAAIACTDSLSGGVVTTDWVIVELGNYLSQPGNRGLFLSLLTDLQTDPQIEIVPADRELLGAGLQLFSDRRDKGWSVTDCISFVVMQRSQLTDALTADKHFEQAGFVRLMK